MKQIFSFILALFMLAGLYRLRQQSGSFCIHCARCFF